MSNNLKICNIKNINISKWETSNHITQFRLNYNQNGECRSWEAIEFPESVDVVVFNITREKLIFVKQFRPDVYFSNLPEELKKDGKIDTEIYPASIGCTVELCNGIIDSNKSAVEVAKKELLKKYNYDVPVGKIEKIIRCRANTGVLGKGLTIYYCEVTDDMLIKDKNYREDIEIIEMSSNEAREFINRKVVESPARVLFGITWFLLNKISL